MPTKEELRELQKMPLDWKVMLTKERIKEWYEGNNGNVYVSFSGGKDSTVLLHLVRELYPDVPAVFSNTGLEFPEIVQFVRKHENVIEIRPTWGRKDKAHAPDEVMTFRDVLLRYGYPLFGKEIALRIHSARYDPKGFCYDQFFSDKFKGSAYDKSKYKPIIGLPIPISDKCCMAMKKTPLSKIKTKPYVAIMTEESLLREQAWTRTGCNAFEGDHPKSSPMAFWTNQDVLTYIKQNNIEICSVYGDLVYTDEEGNEYPNCFNPEMKLKCSGASRTGCIFCAFGLQMEKGETRFQRLKETHPKLYEYCIGGGEWVDNPKPMKNWNPPKIWQPSKTGLGFGKVFDMVNETMGKEMMRYK